MKMSEKWLRQKEKLKRCCRTPQVSTGTTAHAESVKITFDPRTITYGRLLQIYFSVAHDPTELNRQGPDAGTQYRSAIFPASAEQTRIAKAYITQLNDTHAFDAPIVTVIDLAEPSSRLRAITKTFSRGTLPIPI